MGHTAIVCGVSGCGKTTVGVRLVRALGGRFIDADDFHPPENVAKMQSGVPLTDEDRAGWLGALRREIVRQTDADDAPLVLACSALKRRYRAVLAGVTFDEVGGDRSSLTRASLWRNSRVLFVYLKGTRDSIARRLAGRTGHFMPASLLDSQFAALEEPTDEEAVVVSAEEPLDAIVARAVEALRALAPLN